MPKLDSSSPVQPAKYKKSDVLAIQSLMSGTANEHQQQQAIKWIIEDLCKTYDMPYRPGPDGDRETIFASAKMHVGQQLVKMTKLNTANIK
tara:strand:- start:12977 stop:13249 length:273 start_codon:yes stop_codon:yes gene_type:complete